MRKSPILTNASHIFFLSPKTPVEIFNETFSKSYLSDKLSPKLSFANSGCTKE